jgi:VanZ family protein
MWQGSYSPYSGGTVPDSELTSACTGFPNRSPYVRASLSWPPAVSRGALNRSLRLWLPVVLWAGVIFALSAVPSLDSGLGYWDLVLRKLAHTAEFALLAALVLRALGRFWPAFALALAYAASDEIHQHFVRGRVGSPRDVAIDSAGILLGLLAYPYLRRSVAALRITRTGSS